MSITPYPEVNEFLQQLYSKIKTILGKDFVGMYLYGSLALGDFHIDSSDIDVLVATAGKLSEIKVAASKRMHANLEKSGGWAKRLEVSYMPLDVLRKYNPKNAKNPFISTVSKFGIIELGRDWILNRWIIREKGVVIEGPGPKRLIDPISKNDVRQAVKYLLCNSWSQHLNGPEWMRPKKYQAFTVLTMCRALYAIEKGEVVSKLKAAEWANKNLDTQWKPLIQEALASRHIKSSSDITETLKFLKFVIGTNC